MHELSIAESILEIVTESVPDHDKRVLSVTVEVGELTAVIPESLQFCFHAIIEETPYKGAQLIIREKKLTGECRKCGSGFTIKNYFFQCPDCGSTDVQVTGGQELNVTELEVE
ncbi:MAG TPA: hydrogenase maturation nickel metallochaperone HypA [Caldithrix sp.]|nr:hydrogenase maturation nickel metallochaperone HypA [Caldithrix sp.]